MPEFKKASLLDDFEIPEITNDTIRLQLVKLGKTHAIKSRQSMANMPLDDRITYINSEVNKTLGRYKNFIRVIRTKEELNEYLELATKENYLAFDTETNNSLDPLTCKLMGMCCYIPNTKPVYIPINHCKPGTEELLTNQITIDDAKEFCKALKDRDIRLVYHNGKFDIRVIYNTLGIYLPIWWDTMIAAQLLDENELARLKYQFKVHIDPTIDTYNIEKLFIGLPYAWVDPEVFGLYAAIDSYDTYKLQKEQQEVFEQNGFEKLYKLFSEIEVPIVLVCAEMEDTGVCLDVDYLKLLDKKYKERLQKYSDELTEITKPYEDKIKYYQSLGKLDDPVNYESPLQLSIVMYDILKIQPLEEHGRSTDKDTLKALKVPFTEALLNYRQYSILIKTFTTPLPDWLSPKDGKLHANFNQMGAEENNVRTGRFSSSKPNLQQLPSHETSMRMMFMAQPGYAIVGSDFSAQEPRLLTHLANEGKLRDIFEHGRDPYASISSLVFKKDYWECMEHHQDGTPNPDGKALRKKAKTILLGVMYGMGAKLMSKNLGTSIEECKEILDEFFKMFPDVKKFSEYNEWAAKQVGYVEDYMGRRRHLKDARLDELEFRATKDIFTDCEIFPDCTSSDNKISVPDEEANKKWKMVWESEYKGKGYNTKAQFKDIAKEAGVSVFDNGAFISKTLTQCTNARIQGSAASLTKKAMVDIYRDKKLRELGFRILIPIHDELLGECPKENAQEVSERLSQVMIDAAKPECSVAMKCDPYIVKRWYADEMSNIVEDEYYKLTQDKGKSHAEAVDILCKENCELCREVIEDMCNGTYDVLSGAI